ncbi:MAG: membrane protein insertion efficiency factor YidD [bacterium]|nr:membrane protein insertion efficiency factor YidD [bacterium]
MNLSFAFTQQQRIITPSSETTSGRSSWLAMVAIALIDVYRRFISPALGAQCRFYPSCSVYAQRALRKYGFRRGALLAAWRLMRCNPFNPGGVDEP